MLPVHCLREDQFSQWNLKNDCRRLTQAESRRIPSISLQKMMRSMMSEHQYYFDSLGSHGRALVNALRSGPDHSCPLDKDSRFNKTETQTHGEKDTTLPQGSTDQQSEWGKFEGPALILNS